jgi:F-box and WD-40 domain protein 1/11
VPRNRRRWFSRSKSLLEIPYDPIEILLRGTMTRTLSNPDDTPHRPSAAVYDDSISFSSRPIPTTKQVENKWTQPKASGNMRQRLQSLPLVGTDDELADRVRRSLHVGGNSVDHSDRGTSTEEKETRGSGIRALFRRASTSVRARTRRNTDFVSNTFSDIPESRPSTASSAWHKLRQATSFRNSRVFDFDGLEPVDSCDNLVAPIPGIGNAPPVIPRNAGGAAARATAAAQNEHLERFRQLQRIEDPQADRESGVGIAVTVSNNYPYQDASVSSIEKVDFMSRLPIELALQILSQLDHHGLAQAALVSKLWSRVSSNSTVWREAFCREKSSTYAMSGPAIPGSGFGLPTIKPDKPWKDVYRVKHELEANWREGKAKPIYLNGHLDSIYCVQFDE